MAPVCKFYLEGKCRFGNNCKFEHPPKQQQQQTFRNNDNRYSTLQRSDQSSYRDQSRGRNDGRSAPQNAPKLPYSLSNAGIIDDLSVERPQWILSAYGPGIRAPEQLFGGPQREQSFEEMRLLHYIGLATGNGAQAAQHAATLEQNAEIQNRNALNDVDGAIKYILAAESQHPNRIDLTTNHGAASGQPSSFSADSRGASAVNNPFGNNAVQGHPASGFGQPSSFSRSSDPFGAPSQQVHSSISTPFGQPSALGRTHNPFAATPHPTDSKPFGVPSQSAALNPFSSAPGPASINPFDSSSQLAAANPFGAAQQPAAVNPFGSSQPAAVNPFGATPGHSAQANPFGAPTASQPNPFGGSAQLEQVNPFGQPPAASLNPFGNPPSSQSQPLPFSASQPVQQNPFGAPAPQPSPFDQKQPQPYAGNSPNPFGQSFPALQENPFGQSAHQSTGMVASPFNALAQSDFVTNGTSAPNSEFLHPPVDAYASRDGNGKLTMFKGKQVVYKEGEPGVRNRDGSWEKIWFPNGPPPYDKNTEFEESSYDDSIKSAYLHVRETGMFAAGFMPLVPPKREWCMWDF